MPLSQRPNRMADATWLRHLPALPRLFAAFIPPLPQRTSPDNLQGSCLLCLSYPSLDGSPHHARPLSSPSCMAPGPIRASGPVSQPPRALRPHPRSRRRFLPVPIHPFLRRSAPILMAIPADLLVLQPSHKSQLGCARRLLRPEYPRQCIRPLGHVCRSGT